MSQTRSLYDLFQENGWTLRASQMWANWPTIGRKYTGRISDLRALGYVVDCDKEDTKDHLYTLRNHEHMPELWNEFKGAAQAVSKSVEVISQRATGGTPCGGSGDHVCQRATVHSPAPLILVGRQYELAECVRVA